MEIFIIRDGSTAGPFSEDAVRAFLTEGTARPIDMGWCKGMPEWKPLAEVLNPRKPEPEAKPAAPAATNSPEETFTPATGKQKAFLKYLGAEFGENLTKERAALAVSDALETPKLQARIRKWHDDKLRMHADLFQDEIDFRKANRTNRYLERVQTEGADVLKDVTKAHVQVLVESLDKKHPGWESQPDSALWDYLLPAIGEHFPQLVQPAHKGNLKTVSAVRAGAVNSRGTGTMGTGAPPRPTGTLGAMIRGVAFGMIVLGAIIVGHQYWQESRRQNAAPSTTPAAPGTPEKKTATSGPNGADGAVAKEPASTPEIPPPASAETAPISPVVNEAPPPAMNTEKPAVPAPADEKPAAPAPAAPAMKPEPPAAPVAENMPPAPAPRAAVKLTQNIGVMLSNGQVTLPAGTVLRYIATEGPNVRVSWNNNVFFVPAMATDVDDPASAPGVNAVNPSMSDPSPATATPPAATKPKKPSDDL